MSVTESVRNGSEDTGNSLTRVVSALPLAKACSWRAAQRASAILASAFGDPESWNGRITPQIHISDSGEEPFRHQPLECLRTEAFVEGPAVLGLWQRDDDAGVTLELTTDSGKQASGRHTVSSLRAAVLEEPRPAQRGAPVSKNASSAAPCKWALWKLPCCPPGLVDTPVRLLVVDLDARHLTVMTDLAEEEGIDVRTAVNATDAITQCRLEYLDLVMINAGVDDDSGVSLLKAIRTVRPTVRAVLMNGTQVPIRQMLRELRKEPRHVLCFDEFQPIESPVCALAASA
jgi:CheY-like chemotaxis protein